MLEKKTRARNQHGPADFNVFFSGIIQPHKNMVQGLTSTPCLALDAVTSLYWKTYTIYRAHYLHTPPAAVLVS